MNTSITEFKPFEAQMTEFRQRYDGVVYDLSNPEEEKQARSDRYQIGKVISRLDAAHKQIKAPLLEQVKLVDGERKRIKDELLDIQGKIKGQIQAHEDKIAAHQEALQAMVDEIYEMEFFDRKFTAADVEERLAKLKAIDPTDATVFETRTADAALAHRKVIKNLETLLVEQQRHEAEQAELARLRAEKEERERKEREARIRQEAEERARREAQEEIEAAKRREAAAKAAKERAKREALLAAQEAERHRQMAEEEAQRRQKAAAEEAARKERERIEREFQRRQEAERAAEELAERKRQDAQHRKEVEQEICDDFQEGLIMDLDDALILMRAIRDGKIRHVKIEY